jgi:hypothetical protein
MKKVSTAAAKATRDFPDTNSRSVWTWAIVPAGIAD